MSDVQTLSTPTTRDSTRAAEVVRAENVAVDLGGRRVLADVSLSVAAGEFVGLLGPNGAGKTTLLRALLGLVKLRSGTVRLNGLSPAKAAQMIGYVPQRHQFAWEFPISVADVVMSGRVRHIGWLRTPKKQDFRLVRQALKRVEMDHLAERTVGELSGGQRQRVLIARALAADPSALMLDEPFTGVDLPTQEMLTDLFCQLADEGTTVLMTTHDIAAAALTCRRLCLINKGIVADGAPADLDEQAWMTTFGVSATSPLLTVVAAGQRAESERLEKVEAVAC